jgi:uncharacterized protein (DUF1330 family)
LYRHGFLNENAVFHGETDMAMAYWVSTYRFINDPDKLAAYAKIAGPALLGAGARFVVRGMPAKIYEAGMSQRTVVVEFDNLEHAISTHDSPAYGAALAALADGVVRDLRVVEGMPDSTGMQPPVSGKRGYMVNTYRSIKKPDALAAYAALAHPAMAAANARFLVRGMPAKVYESGVMERTVVVEFDSVKDAIAAYDGAEYAKALAALGTDAVVRDMRVVEGAA